MKAVFACALLAIMCSTAASAAVTTFKCQTTKALHDRKVHKVEFKIENLGSRRPQLVEDEDGMAEMKTTPARSPFAGLGENWGIKNESDKLVMTGDSDGFYLINLTLYKDNHFENGFVRIEDIGEGFGDQYSPVTCSVR